MFMTFVVIAFARSDAFAPSGSSVFPKGFLVAFAVRKTSPGFLFACFAFETHFISGCVIKWDNIKIIHVHCDIFEQSRR